MRDWRLPENRLEAFTRVYDVRLREGDLDHHHVGEVICHHAGYDNEKKIEYSLLFGQSYRNHWAMIALQLWDDPFSFKGMDEWNNENWWRLKFGNDTKWGVRRLPEFFRSVQELRLRVGSLYDYFNSLAHEEDGFYKVNRAIRSIKFMGRMTAWLAQQTMYEFFGWENINHWDIQLHEDGTWSQYDALCYLFNRLDLARKEKMPDGSILKRNPTKEDIRVVEGFVPILRNFMEEYLGKTVDIYNVESVLCEFRKTAYGPKIKEFTFWTTNELVEQFTDLHSRWEGQGIDWYPYCSAFLSKGEHLVTNYGYDPSYFKVFSEHGLNLNTHFYYPDEPDAFEVLGLPRRRPESLDLIESLGERREDFRFGT